MVAIAHGSFLMGDLRGIGSNTEKPEHEVHIPKPFAIGRFPVTFEEYDRFAQATGRPLPSDEGWGRGRLPVINVSWQDAVDYAAWLVEQTGRPYRLPSEAEWEYAARAGTQTDYWWGDEFDAKWANGDGSVRRTSPVGTYPANRWNLCDTAGNVWEWVQDRWHKNYKVTPTDGGAWDAGNEDGRVVRGGSWLSIPLNLRSASRVRDWSDEAGGILGFRVARAL